MQGPRPLPDHPKPGLAGDKETSEDRPPHGWQDGFGPLGLPCAHMVRLTALRHAVPHSADRGSRVGNSNVTW